VDTLSASSHLRRLRDFGLLDQKGSGNQTYYEASNGLLETPIFSYETSDITSGAPDITSGAPDITSGAPDITSGAPDIEGVLPDQLVQKLQKIKKRASNEIMSLIIKELCGYKPMTLTELGILLRRDPQHLRKRYLSKLIDSKEVEYIFPDNPTHPLQAYRLSR
jgi:ATP-dependent DNA helicase RecG